MDPHPQTETLFPAPAPTYDTARNLAKRHGVSVSAFYTAFKTGRLIGTRVGGRVLIDVKDAERYAHLVKLYHKD